MHEPKAIAILFLTMTFIVAPLIGWTGYRMGVISEQYKDKTPAWYRGLAACTLLFTASVLCGIVALIVVSGEFGVYRCPAESHTHSAR